MLVDTDIIIWCLRGNHRARNVLKQIDEISISAITYMEVLFGLKDLSELREWKNFVHSLKIKNIHILPEISSKATHWMEGYCLSHRLELTDAIIAATADYHSLELLTGNYNDYKFLPGLKIEKFRAQ